MKPNTLFILTLFISKFTFSQEFQINTNEAASFAGKTKNVFGWVDSVKSGKTQTIIYLSSGLKSSSEQTVQIKIFVKDYRKFKRPFADYPGQPVNVTGIIKMVEKIPQINVTSEENLILQPPPPMEIVN
jgi:hypothetical protein